MKTRLLDFLVCPACAGQLTCNARTRDAEEIVTGELVCERCRAAYPISRGIPRLLPGTLILAQQRTAEAFGWEWQEFRKLHATGRYREQFQDWIDPIQPEFFIGKTVLDAGCGMGRFAITSADFGARDVLAVDVSQAVEVAAENARNYPNVHVIQADIYQLPFPRRSADADAPRAVIDFAYSIGVLHHLEEPEAGFVAISEHLKDGGALFAWVYGRENNDWIVRAVNPIRESVSSRLPRRVLYALSLVLAIPLQIVLKLLYFPRSSSPRVEALQRRLPYRAYLKWLAGFGLRHNHHVIFDHLVAPTAFYIRRADFAAWFERAGFKDITLSWRNQNSWRGLGRLPAGVGSVHSP